MRVLFSCRPFAGHYRPMLPLARALVEAGHEVAFAAGEPIASEALQHGFASFAVGFGTPDLEARSERLRAFARTLPPAQIRSYMFAELFARIELEPRARELGAVVDDWRPDLLVHEVAELAAPLVATKAGLPYAEHGFGPAVASGVLRAAAEAAAPFWAAQGLAPHPLAGFYRYLYLDVCPSGLQPLDAQTGPTQPLRIVEVGGTVTLPPWLEAARGQTIVYVTLGTVYNRDLDVFRTLLDGLRDETAHVVVTLGNEQPPEGLGPQPPNVHVHRYVPQESLLPYCAAVVAHAGAGTTLGALAFGLPLLLVPRGADQFYNAERVCAAGAGLQLSPEHLTADAVRDAVRELLHEPAFRSSAQRIQAEIARMPPPREAVLALERLVAGPVA